MSVHGYLNDIQGINLANDPGLRSSKSDIEICRVQTKLKCGQNAVVLKDISRENPILITSPNFPDEPSRSQCQFTFEIPANTDVYFEISRFLVSKNNDKNCKNDVIHFEFEKNNKL